jgi:hypothetical protein
MRHCAAAAAAFPVQVINTNLNGALQKWPTAITAGSGVWQTDISTGLATIAVTSAYIAVGTCVVHVECDRGRTCAHLKA